MFEEPPLLLHFRLHFVLLQTFANTKLKTANNSKTAAKFEGFLLKLHFDQSNWGEVVVRGGGHIAHNQRTFDANALYIVC